MIRHDALLEELGRTSDEFVDGANTQTGHDFARFSSDAHHIVYHVIGSSFELSAPFGVGGCNSYGAVVEVALAHVDTAHRDHGNGSKVHLLRSQDGSDDDVASGAEAAIGSQGDIIPKLVHHENLMGF